MLVYLMHHHYNLNIREHVGLHEVNTSRCLDFLAQLYCCDRRIPSYKVAGKVREMAVVMVVVEVVVAVEVSIVIGYLGCPYWLDQIVRKILM